MVAAGEGVVLTLICLSFCLSAFSKNHSVKTKITKNYTQLHTTVHRQEYFKKIFISLFCIHTIRLRRTAQNWNSFGGIQQLYVTWKWGWQRGDGKGKRGKWEFLKGRKAGEINRNYATILNISQSKEGPREGAKKKKKDGRFTHTHTPHGRFLDITDEKRRHTDLGAGGGGRGEVGGNLLPSAGPWAMFLFSTKFVWRPKLTTRLPIMVVDDCWG